MKFYKRKNLDDNNVKNNSFAVEANGKIVTDLTSSMQVPSGTVAERPSAASPDLNQVRYNTQLFDLEASVRGTWERVRTVRPATIFVQNLGSGNYYSTFFGPLNIGYQESYDAGPENIDVYIDNVFQVPYTNYDLTTDPSPATAVTTATTTASTSILFLDNVTNVQPGTIVSGAAGITSGTTVVATFTGTFNVEISEPTIGDITPGTTLSFSFNTGTYIQFAGEVPAKPVVAILGKDGFFPPG
jgi:hypothetical protein